MVILSGTRRMRYAAILAKIIVVALVFALMWIAMPAGVAVGETYKGVDFPLGDKSFADGVVSFNPGTDTVSPYNNPQSAIGTPNGCGENAVALGHGGVLTVKFTDNYLIDVEGPDLYVFECGGRVEPFKVEISKDGSNWIDLGTVKGQPTSLDIHDKVASGDKFSYVRITDGNSHRSGHPYAGADIDAVGAIGAEEIKEIILKASKEEFLPKEKVLKNSENSKTIRISGTVKPSLVGQPPLKGAKVEIIAGANPTHTYTSAEGFYEITAEVPDGKLEREVSNFDFTLEPEYFIITVTVEPDELPADGLSTAEIKARVTDSEGEPMPDRPIDFEADCEDGVGSLKVTQAITDSNGIAKALYTSFKPDVCQQLPSGRSKVTITATETYTERKEQSSSTSLKTRSLLGIMNTSPPIPTVNFPPSYILP